jgi:hypothetical protein
MSIAEPQWRRSLRQKSKASATGCRPGANLRLEFLVLRCPGASRGLLSRQLQNVRERVEARPSVNLLSGTSTFTGCDDSS